MTGRTKGWAAVAILVAILLGAGAALSRSEPGRIRFLAWRAGSADPNVRRKARLDLLAIGRPAIDPVLVGAFVREVRERSRSGNQLAIVQRDPLDEWGWDDRCIFVEYHDDEVHEISGVMLTPDPVALAFERLAGSRRVVLLERTSCWDVVVSCPLDEGTEDRLFAAFPELKPR